MFGSPETLVAQNNYSFEDLIATGHRQNPMWDKVDIEYWALSKKQYHGPYTSEAAQAMTGTMNIANALSKIQVPAIILKADASPEVRKTNEQAAAVMQRGKLVHIDGAAHNLHHDKLDHTTRVLKEFLSTL
jgi:pimeloyl-ACP methyl ester carboxylesterase